MTEKQQIESLPDIFIEKQQFFKTLGERKPLLFFDYDGTLTPIVNDPDAAILSDRNKSLIVQLSKYIPVAIVSGRDLRDLRSKVGIEQVIYAGSHGFEITGPDGLQMTHEAEDEITPALDDAERNLNEKLNDLHGVKVERKKYAIAVHYRNADEKDVPYVKEIIEEELERQKNLKKGTGKMIVELKPDLDWHKGYALDWLIEQLKWDLNEYLPIFIGDDITDEDAFATIREKGIGIIVGTHGEKTAATYRLEDTDAVTVFLELLLERLSNNN